MKASIKKKTIAVLTEIERWLGDDRLSIRKELHAKAVTYGARLVAWVEKGEEKKT